MIEILEHIEQNPNFYFKVVIVLTLCAWYLIDGFKSNKNE